MLFFISKKREVASKQIRGRTLLIQPSITGASLFQRLAALFITAKLHYMRRRWASPKIRASFGYLNGADQRFVGVRRVLHQNYSCILSRRQRAIYRFNGLSRTKIKWIHDTAGLPGLQKSSW